eukprot:1047713-Heterocapsa_arctica.AAC.1
MEEDWIEAVRREGYATGLNTDRATSSTATYILVKTKGRGQFHHGKPGCYPNDRHGDEDQGGGFAERRRDKELFTFQEDQEHMWTDQLEHTQACRLLWLLIQT